jgi:hypothetical protein
MWRGVFGGEQQSAVGSFDAGSCTRATREELLASLNRACARTADCPSGGFCDVEVGGFCNFQCYASTECPVNQNCNCFGQCVGPPAADAGTPPDPACPRVPALIQSAAGVRVCKFDDECPHGTYCSPDNGRCAKQCTTDSNCNSADGGAPDAGAGDGGVKICDCFGRCSGAGAAPKLPTAVLAGLAVDPRTITLPAVTPVPVKPSFTAQSLTVTVRAAGTMPSAGPLEKIHAIAGKYLEIKCPAQSCIPNPSMGKTCPAAGSEPFVKECDLENWAWAQDGAGLSASYPVTVRPSSETPGGTEASNQSWEVRLQSSNTASSFVVATVVYGGIAPAPSGASWLGATSVSGGYAGRGRMALPDGTTIPIELKALAQTSTSLALYDASHLLTPSGVLVLPLNGDFRAFKWLTTSLGGRAVTEGVGGFLWGTENSFAIRKNPNDNSLAGTVQFVADYSGNTSPSGTTTLYSPTGQLTIGFQYDLYPKNIQACTSSSCPTGFVCNAGFCTAEADTFLPNGQLLSNDIAQITTTWWSDWHFLESGNLVNNLGINDIMCNYPPASGSLGLLQPTFAKFSGELTCFGNGVGPVDPTVRGIPFNIPLLAHRDFTAWAAGTPGSVQPSQPFTNDQMYASCIDEIQRAAPNSYYMNLVPTQSRAFVDANVGWGKYFDPYTHCVGLGYFLAEAWAARPAGHDGSSTFGQRFYLWMHQQWLMLQAFIARQGLQTNDLDQILSSAAPLSSGQVSDPGVSFTRVDKIDLVNILAKGWSLLLADATAPNTTGRLLETVPASYFSSPDYRAQYSIATNPPTPPPSMTAHPEYEQASGLPTTILETMAATLDVTTAFLTEANAATYDARNEAFSAPRDQVMRRFGDQMRLALVVQTMATAAHDRGCAAAPSPPGAPCSLPWDPRWVQAQGEFSAARDRLLVAAQKMTIAENPLGIPDNDVPLFFGDPTGNTSRYFAGSDYLLNTWAVPAAGSAQTALASARDAWINMKNSQVQDVLLQADRDRRLDQIGEEYGAGIVQNCGISQVAGNNVEGKNVFDLVRNRTISLDNCFIGRTPNCVPAAPAGVTPADQVSNFMVAKLTVDQARHQLCVLSHVMNRITPFASGQVTACISSHPSTWTDVTLGGAADINSRVIICGTRSTFSASLLWSNFGLSQVHPGELLAADQACNAEAAVAHLAAPTFPAGCLHGTMGEAMARMQSASADLDVALAGMQTAEVRVNEQWNQCQLMEADDTLRQQTLTTLQTLRQSYADAKVAAARAQTDAGMFSGLISFAGGIVARDPGAVIGGVSTLVSTAITSGPNEDLAQSEADLQLAQDSYNDLLVGQARTEAIHACFGQAQVYKSELDGARATIKVKKAIIDEAAVQLNNLIVQNHQRYAEGRAALDRETNRPFAGYGHNYWLDEKIRRFRNEFEWAKRLSYLALRSVEYEFQQSLPLRGAILAARHPDQLEDVLRSLQQEQAARTINRRRPEEQSVVISLRDDVLRIASQTGAASGERAWTAAQRFENRLRHPLFTVRDDAGNWLGQGIRFSLDPLANGSSNGVALSNRCGERLWRITATIQGDGLSATQPGSPVFVLKRNTFGSQWCRGLSDGTVRQTSSIQPSRQLFRPADISAPVDESTGFTAAGIYPWFNVRRADFFKLSYQDGSSQELAGRGLYGDYILLFPKELIQGGFPIDRVEDVLVRLDYLSVDNLPPISE